MSVIFSLKYLVLDNVRHNLRQCAICHRTEQQHLFVALQIISNAEYGQCVMYVTSLGIVRTTKARCSSVRKILRNLSVRVYERDVFMSATHCLDLKQRLGGAADISLPQVFIHGHLLGVSGV